MKQKDLRKQAQLTLKNLIYLLHESRETNVENELVTSLLGEAIKKVEQAIEEITQSIEDGCI